MKKQHLLKGMTVVAIAAAMVGCSKEKELYDSNAKVQESATNFVNNVLGGRAVDPSQNWSTAEKVEVSVNAQMGGVLKIYVANPHGQVTAPLITQTIQAGTTKLAVAKPRDVQELFASLKTADGSMNVVKLTDNTALFKQATAASRAARANRAPQAPTVDGWVFAEAPTSEDFAFASQSIPSDALWVNEYGDATKNSVHNYKLLDQTTEQYTNLYAGNFNLWVEGTKVVNYGIPGDGQKNMKIYVMPGANLTFTQNFTQKGAGELTMYVAPTATVNFAGGLQAYMTLYNRGTVTISGSSYKPGIYDGGIFYNEGTFSVLGAQDYWFGNQSNKNPLTLNNNDSQFINAGTLNAGALTLEGSSHFLNLGTVNISGNTIVNSNNCTWINDGTYTTDNYTYHAGSTDVINNCRLTVNNLFTINLGDTDKNCFAINAGGGVTTKDLHFAGPGYIKMAANSLFKVTNEAKMDATKADYGFWGPTSGTGYAVLQAKNIVTSNESQMYDITYGGNMYVAADSHFPNSYPGGANDPRPVIDLVGNAKIWNGQLGADYKITPADVKCSDGYRADAADDEEPIIIPDEPTMYYYYAFEDLGTTDDFDFNDVVLRVSAPVDGKASVEIVAAGGTLECYTTYGLGDNPTVLGAEVHNALGANSTGTMVNTTSVDTSKFAVLGTINVSATDDMANLPFGIKVNGENGTTVRVQRSVANNGKAPLVIVVNGNEQGKWFWATERTNITSAYAGFGDWGASVSTNVDWYKTPTGAVVSY